MSQITLAEGAAAATPAGGKVTIYAKTDGLLYSKDDAGTETALGVSGGGVSDGDKGDVTVSSSGTVWTVDNDAISNAKLANMATATIKGRTTAGTGDPEDLTATQATALLNAMVGDSGSGGTKGLVPAPAAGDAAAGKFLKADGTWAAPSGGGGISDGDKGDITVSGSGATWTIDNDAVTYAKIQNVSATDKILGRSTAGAGDIEEITCTAAGRALLDDADAAAQRTTLGLGSAATMSGPSGAIVGTTDSQTLSNKTIALGSNTISGTKAQFDTACSDGDFAYLGQANTFSQAQSFQGDVLVTSGSAILGYGTGAGGTVTQATSKSTAVTLNKPTGQITMNNASIAAGSVAAFTFNNSVIGTADGIVVTISGGILDPTAYNVWGFISTTGVAAIMLKNISSGPLSEAVKINFEIVHGATS